MRVLTVWLSLLNCWGDSSREIGENVMDLNLIAAMHFFANFQSGID